MAGWQLIARVHVEAFLPSPPDPDNQTRHLQALQVFFRWAHTRPLLLVDPTSGLRTNVTVETIIVRGAPHRSQPAGLPR
ncbi:MAG TPA: hypothetical protein VFP72_04580 [Kineosporiaceae bacterium]|nr:hypothetical protein [Kineosporiaceae bacterium]